MKATTSAPPSCICSVLLNTQSVVRLVVVYKPERIVPGMTQVHQHHLGSLTRSWRLLVSVWDSASLKKPGCQCARSRNGLHLVCSLVRCVAVRCSLTYLFMELQFSSDCIRAKQILTRGTNGICSSRICLSLT